MKRGDQIIYVPLHAEGNINHKDCEYGFVTSFSWKRDLVWCRFWGQYNPDELRTKANSECVQVRDLIWKDSVPQEKVEKQLEIIYGENWGEVLWAKE